MPLIYKRFYSMRNLDWVLIKLFWLTPELQKYANIGLKRDL